MSRTRAAAYLVGGILLAAWLSSAAGVTRPQAVRVPREPAEAVRLDAITSSVQSQALRLRERLAAAPAPNARVRNPFAFAERQVAPAAAVRPAAPPVKAIPPFVQTLIAEPDLVLLGIAEQGAVRTAMIGSGEELLMAAEGQMLAGRYRVSKVGADAVELIDTATGATRRLSLRSPVSLP